MEDGTVHIPLISHYFHSCYTSVMSLVPAPNVPTSHPTALSITVVLYFLYFFFFVSSLFLRSRSLSLLVCLIPLSLSLSIFFIFPWLYLFSSLSPCVGAWMWVLFSASPQTFCTNFFPSIHASSPPTASALQPSTNPSNGLVVHFVFIRQLSVRPAGQSVITSSG